MSKNWRSCYAPLSQSAMDIIERLPKFDGCPHLLPHPQSLKPYTDIKRARQAARKLAGLDDLHLHDLRHSAASFMINAGIDLYTVGKMIDHVSIANITRYSHLAHDTLMAAAEAGAVKLDVNWSKCV